MASLGFILRKLALGLALRCPNCEKGHTFHGLFNMDRVCENCGVRFERRSGESVGGMYLNLGFAELISASGFAISQIAFKPPLLFQLIFWTAFNILFVVLFYRHARSMWVAITYLTHGLTTDSNFHA